MRQSLTELCDLLNEQKTVLGNMFELSQEERQIIINNESDKLESVIRLELKELSKLGSIEKKRMALHKTIAEEMGLSEEELTISVIAQQAQPEDRDMIRKLQSELTDLINRNAEINAENRELIKAHIEYSETMLEHMVGEEDPLNNFYGGDGKAAPDRKKATGFYDGHA